MSDVTTGSQCSTLVSVHDINTVEWSTYWWSNYTSDIKSFSNIQLNDEIHKQLMDLALVSETSEPVVANVAYDFFTSDTAGGANLIEVMVWLASSNAEPISYNCDAEGQAIPIVRNLNRDVTGYRDLYLGSNGSNGVYSFIPTSGNVTFFRGDMYQFYFHNGYVNSSQYLKTAQAGVQATSGSADLTTSAYSLTIN